MNSVMVGGILPALFVGFALTSLKIASIEGMSAGTGIIITGFGVIIAGAIGHFLGLSGFGSIKAISFALLTGVLWGIGTLLMLFSVSKLHLPMAVSASLAATNVVVVVLASLFILGESSSISVTKVIFGMIAILLGSVLVTTA